MVDNNIVIALAVTIIAILKLCVMRQYIRMQRSTHNDQLDQFVSIHDEVPFQLDATTQNNDPTRMGL